MAKQIPVVKIGFTTSLKTEIITNIKCHALLILHLNNSIVHGASCVCIQAICIKAEIRLFEGSANKLVGWLIG